MKKQKTFFQLFIPIFIELVFSVLIGFVDTFMLSAIGDKQVGAVGTANSFISIFVISFNIISSGMMAVMTQYIGAKKEHIAQKALSIGLSINLVLGIIISCLFIFFTPQILTMMKIAPGLKEDAIIYTRLIGGTSLIMAITPLLTTYLRAFGCTTSPLVVTLVANIINIVFNAIFIYACSMGVFGVALATIISRVVMFICLLILVNTLIKKDERKLELSSFTIFKQIIRIGLPAALETIMYNISMSLVMTFVNMMDPDGLNATIKSYCGQITNFCYIASLAMAVSNSIIVGWKIGEGKYDECFKITKKHCIIAILCGSVSALIVTILGRPLMSIFTKDVNILRIVPIIFAIDIVLEIGRATNLLIGQALKTAGDAVFTVVISIIFTLICAVGGTYLFGNLLGLLIIGTWIGLALDEFARGVLMMMRWNSKKWIDQIIVKNH